ncbi:MAG: RidA family protein [Nitrospinota bacterium]
MEKTQILPQGWKQPPTYSHGWKAEGGTTIYVAGQVAQDPTTGELVGAGDIKAQTRQVFENLMSVLSAAGASFKDVVKLTIFITDMSLREQFNEVRTEFLGGHLPASTFVEVGSLVRKEWMIEIEAIAVI